MTVVYFNGLSQKLSEEAE